jgi:hypothetical protein
VNTWKDKRKPDGRKTKANPPVLVWKKILANARKGVGRYGYIGFGIRASLEEREAVYHELLREPEDAVRARLLLVFRRGTLPRLDPPLLDWARSADADLRAAAIAALSRLQDPRIRTLARAKLTAGELLGADREVLKLFLLNHEGGDAARIARALADLPAPEPDDAHSLGFSLVDLVEEDPDPAWAEALEWVYEHTPCTRCRSKAVEFLIQADRLTPEQRFECHFDACEEIRELVGGKNET